jgi:hypothetical protein
MTQSRDSDLLILNKQIPFGTTKRIHVNQHELRKRVKDSEYKEPCYTVKHGKNNTYAREVEILGASKLVERIDKPLPCGARLWLETKAEVRCFK